MQINSLNPMDDVNPMSEYDLNKKYLFGMHGPSDDKSADQCPQRPISEAERKKQEEEMSWDATGKYAVGGFFGLIAFIFLLGGFGSGWFGDRWDDLKQWWRKRGKGDGGDGGGAVGSGGGSPPTVTRVPPDTGSVASRIAEVRQAGIATSEQSSATLLGFSSIVEGLRRFLGLTKPESRITGYSLSTEASHIARAPQTASPAFQAQPIPQMMLQGAAAMGPVASPFAASLDLMLMPLQLRTTI